ncbi:MAG: Gx transporter family protein [Lachnospiraceae bacterium]|nr:Gx transporter family protein [Lachnospiraceae bacterium]
MSTDKITKLGLMLALSVIMGYVEYLIPLPIGIPGVKLGLANIVILYVTVTCGPLEALLILILRILLNGFMFGNVFSMIFAFSGGIPAWLGMTFAHKFHKKLDLSLTGTGMIGGTIHNIGQLTAAVFLVDQLKVIYYLPILLLSGLITGGITGTLCMAVIRRLPHGRESI